MDVEAYDELVLSRQRELAMANSGAELEQLHKRYAAEDRARQDAPNGELHLAKRVASLECCIDALFKKHGGILDNLIGRIETLEQRPTVQYKGVYTDEAAYVPGHMVTHNGSVWHCKSACQGQKPPGNCWTLAVKRGKDAQPVQKSEPVVR
jgi:hypothetical protein